MSQMSQSRFRGSTHNGIPLFPDISKVEGDTKTFKQLTGHDSALKTKLISSKKLLASAAKDDSGWLYEKLNGPSAPSAWKKFSSLATGPSAPGGTVSTAPWAGSNLQDWFKSTTEGLDASHLAELHNKLRQGSHTGKLTGSSGKSLFGKPRKGMDSSERHPQQYRTVRSIYKALNPTDTDEGSLQTASEVTTDSEWIAETLAQMRKAAQGAPKKKAARKKKTPVSSKRAYKPRRSSGKSSTRPKSSKISDNPTSGSEPAHSDYSDPFGDLDDTEFSTAASPFSKQNAVKHREKKKKRPRRKRAAKSGTSDLPSTLGGASDSGLSVLRGQLEPGTQTSSSALQSGYSQLGSTTQTAGGFVQQSGYDPRGYPPPQTWPSHQLGSTPQPTYGSGVQPSLAVPSQPGYTHNPMAASYGSIPLQGPIKSQTITSPSGEQSHWKLYPNGVQVQDTVMPVNYNSFGVPLQPYMHTGHSQMGHTSQHYGGHTMGSPTSMVSVH